MNPQPSLSHAEAYLNIHLSRSGRSPHGMPTGPFVTISRESGSGGSTFARALLQRLTDELPGESPWTVFDRNLVERMLESEHLSPGLARFLPEDKVSEINSSIGELVGLHPSIWSLIQRANELMRQLARAGNAILVGRGANCATEGISGGVHVRLVAPPEFRAQRMATELGVSAAEAAEHNIRKDAARRNYVRSVFETDVGRASGYDLVINTSTISIDQAVDFVMAVLRSRVSAEVTA
jgi:cytidylate kinase